MICEVLLVEVAISCPAALPLLWRIGEACKPAWHSWNEGLFASLFFGVTCVCPYLKNVLSTRFLKTPSYAHRLTARLNVVACPRAMKQCRPHLFHNCSVRILAENSIISRKVCKLK